MEYQFDVSFRVTHPISATNQDEAEHTADDLLDDLIAGSFLEKEYPDADYSIKSENHAQYTLFCRYTLQIRIEGTSIENAEEKVSDEASKLVQGSRLANEQFTIHHTLSDEQPGLDDLLEQIDADQPFAVQEPGERYHSVCAREMFGQKRVDKAEQGQDDDLTVISGREWKQEVRKAFAYKEEIYSRCGHCGGRLYDEPRKNWERTNAPS